jgi:peptidoglycan-associated lipoprotein
MKKIFSIACYLLLISAVLTLSGCQNRGKRPSPDQTLSGMGPGSLEFGMVDNSSDWVLDGGSALTPRGGGPFDGAEQVRGVLQPIFFEFDRSIIGPSERPKATAAAEFLRNNPRDGLLIEGHCDWRGTTEYNLGLGDRRASAVREFLVSLGIDANRIEVLSKGDLEATQGGTEQQMAFDRRAELVVLRR